MANDVLSIDSTWDEATSAASIYRETFVLPLFTAAGLNVNDLSDSDANQQEAAQGVSDPSVIYVTGVCHGTSDAFTGDQDVPIFQTGSYAADTFKGRIVHFLACNTALSLGRDIVASGGAKAFFGYNGLFTWPDDSSGQYSALFFDCDAEIDRALVAGADAGTAMARAIAKYTAQISFLKGKGDTVSLNLAALLEMNRDLLCGPTVDNEFGSAAAKL
jgi:hypothetical protein